MLESLPSHPDFSASSSFLMEEIVSSQDNIVTSPGPPYLSALSFTSATNSAIFSATSITYVIISYFPKDLTSSCRDGLIQLTLNEQCDDGNSKSFDGCSSSCTIETGFRCTEIASLNYRSYCSKDCGNGAIENGEICDDGNYFSGDGCDSNCQEEVGFKCDNSFGLTSSCIPYCGNGVKDASYFEKCDDGNNFNYDGCDAKCKNCG